MTFNICRYSMKRLYEMNATDAAKRELWDMCIIAEGGTPSREFGGVNIEFDDGSVIFKKELPVQPVKEINTTITVGNVIDGE